MKMSRDYSADTYGKNRRLVNVIQILIPGNVKGEISRNIESKGIKKEGRVPAVGIDRRKRRRSRGE